MASNIRDFNLGLQQAGEAIPEDAAKLHRAVALEALKGVVQTTPVDTGRARGNWQVTVGEPAAGTLEQLDKSGGATIAIGATAVATIPAFSVSYLTNNLPYIERLENGYSKQAPAGMVSVTVQRLRNWLARQR